MLEEIGRTLLNVTFWLHVLGACLFWYLLARIIASVAFSSGGEAYRSARKGVFAAILPAVLVAGVVEWFWIGSLLWLLVHATLVILIPLILVCVLISLEPARQT